MTKTRALPQVPERLLAKLWRERAVRADVLSSQDGRRLRVRYPGRLSSAAGPDLRDAVLEDEAGHVLRGDVEVHRDEADWRAHGHGRDPRYSNVVLHVVLNPETGPAPNDFPPALALGPLAFRVPPMSKAPSPWETLAACGYRQPGSAEEMALLLDRAGEQRFQEKAVVLGAAIERVGASQALYEGLMDALGYSQNRAPFVELAGLAPYEVVRETALRATPLARQRAVLSLLQARSVGLAWHTFRVRPANHPAHRMAGAAALVCRYAEAGLVAGLEGLVRGGDVRALEAGLTVSVDGVTLLGRGRAADMAVNVVLPFFFALAQRTGDTALAEQALQLYRRWPGLQQNELTREAAALLLAPGQERVPERARHQQGLVHLYRLLTGTGGHAFRERSMEVGVVR